MLTSKGSIEQIDDVVIISFFINEAILRKFVLVYRERSSTFGGQIHMYDGFNSFNYHSVGLQKTSEECSVTGNPNNLPDG